jgi:hypothetical protein
MFERDENNKGHIGSMATIPTGQCGQLCRVVKLFKYVNKIQIVYKKIYRPPLSLRPGSNGPPAT